MLHRKRFLWVIGATSILLTTTQGFASEFAGYDSPPVPIKKVRPVYPEFARDAQIRGKVILHVLVGTEGHVKSVKVVRGVRGLDGAAVEAVRQWVFTPALSNGEPALAWIAASVWLPLDACPPEVLERGRAIVVARVGEAFFAENLSVDSAATAMVFDATRDNPRPVPPPYWSLAYKLRIPTKAWVEGTIHANVDLVGSAIAGSPVDGIGDCYHHPEQCVFSVDEQGAREIAKRAGLGEEFGPWEARFQWVVREEPCYAWVVSNIVGGGGLSREADTAIIDANSGRLLGIEHRDSEP